MFNLNLIAVLWRAFVLKKAAVLLLLLSVAVAAGGNNSPTGAENQAIDDPVEFANTAIANKQFTQAEEFIRQILTNPTLPSPLRDSLRYLLGLSLSGQQKYSEAIEIFRQILDSHPRSSKVRLALGRVLFLNGNDDAAKRQLDLVLADKDLPLEVKKIALQHISDIERRNGWQFAGSINLVLDSNSTQAPEGSDRTFYAYGWLPLTTDNDEEASVGADVNVSAIHKKQIAANRQWINRFSIGQRVNAGEWDAATSLYYSTGIRQFFGGNSIGVAGLLSHHFSSGHADTTSYGGQVDGQYIINRRLRTSGLVQYNINDTHKDSDRKSKIRYVQGRADFGLSPVANGYIKLHGQKNGHNNKIYDYTNIGAELGVRHDFAWGITGGASGAWSQVRYHEINRIAGYKHEYTNQPTKLTLLKRNWRILGITPEVEVTFFTRKSNISIYSYKTTTYNLNLTKNF